ncbi:CpaF/VirB11 family protein [Insolitispirillum peregrinum]|uniref:CpaF/VirB11 family protein n=1 Tax=Insolitispirillum peregrinum TaxID=80876 RepID=UPI0036108D5A
MIRNPVIDKVLEPLSSVYNDPTTVEIRMVQPGQLIIDRRGTGKRRAEVPELTVARVETICKTLAYHASINFDPIVAPKLSCILPDRHRFECLVGGSVQSQVSLAIRCKHAFVPTWEQVGATPEVVAFLQAAIEREDNIIVSGATNTGKTTLLNRLLTFLPENRRVIAAEDTPELEIARFWDGVGLMAGRDAADGGGMVDWRQMYDHLMRATPDHVIFGEISTTNSFAALAALNAGITGFMCTIHAESPQQALDRKFEQNIAWSGQSMPRVSEFLRELVDLVIQIKRTPDGMRRITDLYQPRLDRWIMRNGVVQPVLDGRQKKGEAA